MRPHRCHSDASLGAIPEGTEQDTEQANGCSDLDDESTVLGGALERDLRIVRVLVLVLDWLPSRKKCRNFNPFNSFRKPLPSHPGDESSGFEEVALLHGLGRGRLSGPPLISMQVLQQDHDCRGRSSLLRHLHTDQRQRD
jgi:hypothetical protein